MQYEQTELQPIEICTQAWKRRSRCSGRPSGERPLLGDAERAALHALAAGTEPLAEVRDRARPERHVDVRVEREEALALRLGVAAADGDHLARVALLERARLSEMGREALVRLLADRAGVEDEHVRLLLLRCLAEAELLEHALDPLRVVGVHLAAERRHVVSPHRLETLARGAVVHLLTKRLPLAAIAAVVLLVGGVPA